MKNLHSGAMTEATYKSLVYARVFLAELQHAERTSRAPWVRIFGKPMRSRKVGCVRPPAHPPASTDSRGEGGESQCNPTGREGGKQKLQL